MFMQKVIADGFRLSPQQRRLWLLQRGGEHLPYRTQCAILIEGNLDVGMLRMALARVVERIPPPAARSSSCSRLSTGFGVPATELDRVATLEELPALRDAAPVVERNGDAYASRQPPLDRLMAQVDEAVDRMAQRIACGGTSPLRGTASISTTWPAPAPSSNAPCRSARPPSAPTTPTP
jgi:hypothetical protein